MCARRSSQYSPSSSYPSRTLISICAQTLDKLTQMRGMRGVSRDMMDNGRMVVTRSSHKGTIVSILSTRTRRPAARPRDLFLGRQNINKSTYLPQATHASWYCFQELLDINTVSFQCECGKLIWLYVFSGFWQWVCRYRGIIAALTTLVGSSAAESLLLGDRGFGGLAWAAISAFGALFVIKACVTGASASWLGVTLGVRNVVSDEALGTALSLERGRSNDEKARRNLGEALGIICKNLTVSM
jgi:hypothetical protein